MDKLKAWLLPVYNDNNVGDMAISEVAKYLIAKSGRTVEEISYGDYWIKRNEFFDSVDENDIIYIQGGGNMSNRYLEIEEIRRDVICHLQNNRIIVLPQTFWFTDDPIGRHELQVSRYMYEKHHKVTLYAREHESYQKMKNCFPKCDIKLCPDIVFLLCDALNIERKINDTNLSRQEVLFIIRKDSESVLDEKSLEKIKDIFIKWGYELVYSDYNVTNECDCDRRVIIEGKLQEIDAATIVVTDRLHGMIFSTIMSKPCIALSNENGKIKNVFELIKDIEYVRYLSVKSDNLDIEIQGFLEYIAGKQFDYSNVLKVMHAFFNDLSVDIATNMCDGIKNKTSYYGPIEKGGPFWLYQIEELRSYVENLQNTISGYQEEERVQKKWVADLQATIQDYQRQSDEQVNWINTQQKTIESYQDNEVKMKNWIDELENNLKWHQEHENEMENYIQQLLQNSR